MRRQSKFILTNRMVLHYIILVHLMKVTMTMEGEQFKVKKTQPLQREKAQLLMEMREKKKKRWSLYRR